ncbi:hypothetical protein KP509_12G083400 [Ceratopteris richardii]|uniref:F-box domain-containing protein n=1 Tax=Ceratopteris richardii TaxID=49495 RepID=A0A8T2TKP4_CERRI|nr:hypothetical protein KP509_12G083400 [Ceratopteris richardii]
MADELLFTSPSSGHPDLIHCSDIDLDCFFAFDSPSASASSPPTRNPDRSHPPSRHRRCLFGTSCTAPDPQVSKPPPTPASTTSDPKSCRKRGAYNCGKCGQPKRGHVCAGESAPVKSRDLPELHPPTRQSHLVVKAANRNTDQSSILSSPHSPLLPSDISFPVSCSSLTSSCSSNERYKRALQQAAAFSDSVEASVVADADHVSVYSDNSYDLEDVKAIHQAIPIGCIVKILSRLSPSDLAAASNVCKRWRQSAEYVWAGIRKTSVTVTTPQAEDDFLPLMLQKCSSLEELTLNVSSELGNALLKCISNRALYLSSLEVSMGPGGHNTITGDGLTDLLRRCKTLKSVKVEGCERVTEVELTSPRLTTLWLTGCHRLNYMFLNCPQLSELCLDFLPCGQMSLSCESTEESDHMAAIMKNLGSSSKGLTRLHVASRWLHDRVIHGLLSPALTRSLRMLSLTLGSGISDQSVAAIAASCSGLELLDLSGSSITDMALELIGNSFSESLTRLLIALCPNISQHGLELLVSKLPHLQVLDCGMVAIENNHAWTEERKDINVTSMDRSSYSESKNADGELKFHHQYLQKLSLWGCTRIKALKLDCTNLVELNLTGCSNLEPGRLHLQCPSLKDVYVKNCGEDLLYEIQCQLELVHLSSQPLRRRQDGSKRVQALNNLGP